MNILADLFLTFCRVGGFTFGGGYAMLPMLQKEIVENKHWASEDELLDYFAIGQCTPGVIAVNTATFIGYKKSGISGAIAATGGVIFPSFVIVSIIAMFLQNFNDIYIITQAFSAIRVVVGVLILQAVIKMWKKTVVDKICAVLAVLTFFFSVMFKVSPIIIIICVSILGVLIPVFRKGGEK